MRTDSCGICGSTGLYSDAVHLPSPRNAPRASSPPSFAGTVRRWGWADAVE